MMEKTKTYIRIVLGVVCVNGLSHQSSMLPESRKHKGVAQISAFLLGKNSGRKQGF